MPAPPDNPPTSASSPSTTASTSANDTDGDGNADNDGAICGWTVMTGTSQGWKERPIQPFQRFERVYE